MWSGAEMTPVLKSMTLMMVCFFGAVDYIEINMSDNEIVQKVFVAYHAALFVAMAAGALAHGASPLAWMFPSLVAAFGLGAVIGS